MNETKWTPGPWYFSDSRDQIVQSQNSEGYNLTIADCSGSFVLNDETKKANARLISKAPEMVAALRQCEAIFNVEKIDPMKAFIVIEKIRALLSEIENGGEK